MIHKSLTLAQANELRAAFAKVAPAPEKGAHVGKGRHVPMPETWDGNGKVPPGWVGLDGVFEEEELEETIGAKGEKIITKRKLGTYAVGVMEIAPEDRVKLTPAELLKVDAAINDAKTATLAELED